MVIPIVRKTLSHLRLKLTSNKKFYSFRLIFFCRIFVHNILYVDINKVLQFENLKKFEILHKYNLLDIKNEIISFLLKTVLRVEFFSYYRKYRQNRMRKKLKLKLKKT